MILKSKTSPELCRRIKNRKWIGIGAIVAVFAVCGPVVSAQQPKKVYRIGILQRSTLPASFLEAFKRGMREHGYIEGRNIVIVNLGTDGISESNAAELVRQGVDVIVATGTGAVLDAKKATRTIPIVMSPAADAVAGGLIEHLARPGGNITGLTMITSDLASKRLEVLKEAVPVSLELSASILSAPGPQPSRTGSGIQRRELTRSV